MSFAPPWLLGLSQSHRQGRSGGKRADGGMNSGLLIIR